MTQGNRLFNITDGPGDKALRAVLGSERGIEISFFESGSWTKFKVRAQIHSLEDESRGAGDCWKFTATVVMPYGNEVNQRKDIQGYYSSNYRIGQFTFAF